MNYRNIALGVLLSGAVLAVPAFAGVTDTGNGNIVRTTTTNYFTNVKANASVSFCTGDATQYWSAESGEMAGNISDSNVQGVIAQYKNAISAWIESKRSSEAGIKEETITEGVSSSYYEVHDEIVNSKTETGSSSNVILVGDYDDLDRAYAAQGTVTINTILDKHQTYQINGHGVVSPIILDLDGDGRISASKGEYLPHANTFSADGAVMFDFYGNGFPVAIEWVGANDGLLCRVAEDGRINGTHLFGTSNGYANGFEEMASLDADNSGALEGAELEGLRVWTDKNHDGVSQDSELMTLSELGITSISVNHDNMVGSFVRNGQSYKSFDWFPSVKDVRRINVANR